MFNTNRESYRKFWQQSHHRPNLAKRDTRLSSPQPLATTNRARVLSANQRQMTCDNGWHGDHTSSSSSSVLQFSSTEKIQSFFGVDQKFRTHLHGLCSARCVPNHWALKSAASRPARQSNHRPDTGISVRYPIEVTRKRWCVRRSKQPRRAVVIFKLLHSSHLKL